MNFSTLWAETGSTIEKATLAIALGVIIASLYMLFEKRFMGKFIRSLTKWEVYTTESAKTLSEMEIKPSIFLRKALKNPTSALSRLIVCVLPDGKIYTDCAREIAEAEYNRKKGEPKPKLPKIDIDKCSFYLPENKKSEAEERYSQKGSTLVIALFGAVLVLVLAYIIIKYLPLLIEWRPFE